ncbi:multicopper oxidase family protein [Granulicoccus phenolivorans]|uniref:multicopper oxidase family protein n=1 Tax=Granulicoccus phenolivorans TaxID=266854 RepID=UPI000412D1DB|nr:multicopper oxidase family protein [Granulicoccus phenolivorans]
MIAPIVLALLAGWLWWDSRLPDAYGVHDMGIPDYGGGPPLGMTHQAGQHDAPADGGRSVTDFIADPNRPADVHVDLVARFGPVTLADGTTGNRYSLNGQTPGPEIRARQGQLIEVVLHNENIPTGTVLHWHGVEVPAAMDGVAGVTQDAVPPGGSFTYRFVANRAGSFWYHSHQVSHEQVSGGLFGALIIEPADGPIRDEVAMLHTYPGTTRTLNGVAGEVFRAAAVGEVVRVRVANTDSVSTVVWVTGGPYQLVAIDGTDLVGPAEVSDRKIALSAAGRVDLLVRIPAGGVRIRAPGVALLLAPPGQGGPPQPVANAPTSYLDPLSYGSPAPAPFDVDHPTRRFDYAIGRFVGFLNGVPGIWWTINGKMGRHVPMYVVAEGDIVRMRIDNTSGDVHPMHLHGHRLLVLSRNGVPSTGSPWWVDSLDVLNGEHYEVAFVADNPGVWMDHCHNLPHASEGLMTHLSYAGVDTPYRMGPYNHPE